jgi:hypothetical protein
MNTQKTYLLLLLVLLFFTGCDSKELKHYKSGGDLLCQQNNWISKDITRTINSGNSSYQPEGGELKRNPQAEGFNQGDIFFDIDDCDIK